MERRRLLVASTAMLAWAPLHRSRAQAPGQAGGAAPANPSAVAPAGATASTAADKPFTSAQLDQMLAPIALYPDGLLAQVMMAATYLLEVAEATGWLQANPGLTGDAAISAAKAKGWDPSVTSLVAFPQVLAMLGSRLDWTQKLGDAMLAQQSDVAASIQRLRAQAQTAGNLKTTPQQKVTNQALAADVPAGTPPPIVIEPADPNTVYVPSYNPNSVYGTWPYPQDPPIYFPPAPNYGSGVGPLAGLAFGTGIGLATGFFGGWAWHGGWGGGWGWHGWSQRGNDRYVTANNRVWDHDPDHRHGVPYRDAGSRDRYGQNHAGADSRRAYRGRGDDGRDGRGDHRGYEDRGRAFSGVGHGDRVRREAARGRSHGPHGGSARRGDNHGGGHRDGRHGGRR